VAAGDRRLLEDRPSVQHLVWAGTSSGEVVAAPARRLPSLVPSYTVKRVHHQVRRAALTMGAFLLMIGHHESVLLRHDQRRVPAAAIVQLGDCRRSAESLSSQRRLGSLNDVGLRISVDNRQEGWYAPQGLAYL
jgi:hypothetical protein